MVQCRSSIHPNTSLEMHTKRKDSEDLTAKQRNLELVVPVKQNRSRDKCWNCPFCSKVFSVKKDLTYHLQEVHGARDQSKCNICGKMFRSKNGLDMHMVAHEGGEQFECPMCGKRFVQKHHLEGHMNKHAGRKPFKCSACDKSFAYVVSARQHERNVHGIKAYRSSKPNFQ